MKQAIRPAIFKWRQTEPELILCAVRWYLRYSLSFRDVEELLRERGLEADHTTIWRWVQRYGPELEERLRRHLKPTNKSWRVDETYVRVKGRWCYLYRAIDSTGATINFVLSGLRDAATATRLWVSNSLSGRRWQLNQVPAVRCPPYVVEVRTGYRVSARHGERRVAVQGRVAPCRVVVGLEVGEFPLQIPPIPEEHLVQKFSPYRADQALYKGV